MREQDWDALVEMWLQLRALEDEAALRGVSPEGFKREQDEKPMLGT